MTSPACAPCWATSRHSAIDHHAVELDQPERAVAAHRIETGDVEAAPVEVAHGVEIARHVLVDADYRRLCLQCPHGAQTVAGALQYLNVEALGVELEIG